MPARGNTTLIFKAFCLALAMTAIPLMAKADEFGSLLHGRVIHATDGQRQVAVRLRPGNEATAETPSGEQRPGKWWPRPDGMICVDFQVLWEGGNCGFIRKDDNSYTLTLGQWTYPPEWTETRDVVRTDFDAPPVEPAVLELKREKLIDKTLTVEGKYGPASTAFKADGTFDYSGSRDTKFRGHWWVNDQGELCLASRFLWRLGVCFVPRGSAQRIDYLVTKTEIPFWYPAKLSSK